MFLNSQLFKRSKREAFNNNLGWLPDGVIASGADLNNFTRFITLWGFGFKNCFSTQGCIIFVLPYGGEGYCWQIGIDIQSVGVPHYRILSNNIWLPWQKIATNSDLNNFIPTDSRFKINKMWMWWDEKISKHVLKVEWYADGTSFKTSFTADGTF